MALFLLCGCYNIVLVNIGSVSRQATGALAPEVQCAALASPKVTHDNTIIDALKVCEQAVATQKALDHKEARQ
jgi:hypothetical protein